MAQAVYYVARTNEDLVHYGVLGMKWGVRRNARLLASSRRNKKIRKANEDYYNEKIDKSTRDARVKKAKIERDKVLEDTKAKVKNSSERELKKTSDELKSQVAKEVSNYQVKRGMAYANEIFTKYNAVSYGVVAAAGVASANPALAAAGAVGIASSAAYGAGRNWVLDRYS